MSRSAITIGAAEMIGRLLEAVRRGVFVSHTPQDRATARRLEGAKAAMDAIEAEAAGRK